MGPFSDGEISEGKGHSQVSKSYCVSVIDRAGHTLSTHRDCDDQLVSFSPVAIVLASLWQNLSVTVNDILINISSLFCPVNRCPELDSRPIVPFISITIQVIFTLFMLNVTGLS